MRERIKPSVFCLVLPAMYSRKLASMFLSQRPEAGADLRGLSRVCPGAAQEGGDQVWAEQGGLSDSS